ncbi:hypothetical protein [Treponema sp.]|uniref:hypothetical protein n=1 Tax=Treponema sp. TaxID=166 RepID=UPI0025D7CE0C|nr:hypothetical protein [Treponema sp.]
MASHIGLSQNYCSYRLGILFLCIQNLFGQAYISPLWNSCVFLREFITRFYSKAQSIFYIFLFVYPILKISIEKNTRRKMLHWILSQGADIEPLEPADFVEKWREWVLEMYNLIKEK